MLKQQKAAPLQHCLLNILKNFSIVMPTTSLTYRRLPAYCTAECTAKPELSIISLPIRIGTCNRTYNRQTFLLHLAIFL